MWAPSASREVPTGSPGLGERLEDGQVRDGPRDRPDVGERAPEEPPGEVEADVLDLVDLLVPLVVALAGQALRVPGMEVADHQLLRVGRQEVLGGDQGDRALEAQAVALHRVPDPLDRVRHLSLVRGGDGPARGCWFHARTGAASFMGHIPLCGPVRCFGMARRPAPRVPKGWGGSHSRWSPEWPAPVPARDAQGPDPTPPPHHFHWNSAWAYGPRTPRAVNPSRAHRTIPNGTPYPYSPTEIDGDRWSPNPPSSHGPSNDDSRSSIIISTSFSISIMRPTFSSWKPYVSITTYPTYTPSTRPTSTSSSPRPTVGTPTGQVR